MNEDVKREALKLFDGIQAAFPHLTMQVSTSEPYLALSVEALRQPGLEFDVYLNLQNDDELHLCAGEFWCSWFPISKPSVIQDYREAVVGVLSGDYQIVEFIRWGRGVGADLQAPEPVGWKTIRKSRHGLLPSKWFAQRRVLRNLASRPMTMTK